ncbi:DUF202 domain-containing protein [Streptomyces sp. NPDC090114]|uniref:DUF202 domain-containing protein n=1 Tax=Streptomyces sp. NPDC090114 TaxID=3365950 RepID=UPI0037F379C2
MSGPLPRGVVERDPGLQPERTRLAWRRTTLSGTVAAVLAGRAALAGGGSVGGVVACAVCCFGWLGFLMVAHRRIRGLAGGGGGVPAVMAPRAAAGAVLCTVAMVVCGVVIVVEG